MIERSNIKIIFVFVLLITGNPSLKSVVLLITGNLSLKSVVLLITGNPLLKLIALLITGNSSFKSVVLLIINNPLLRSVVLLIIGNFSLRYCIVDNWLCIIDNQLSVCATSSRSLEGGKVDAWVSAHPLSHLWLSFLKTVNNPRRNSPP